MYVGVYVHAHRSYINVSKPYESIYLIKASGSGFITFYDLSLINIATRKAS